MPLITDYQYLILESLKQCDFQRILRLKGKSHDALIGEFINWWFKQDIDGMICNPARGSKSGSRRYFADLLFLELFEGREYYEVKGVAEVENNEEKFMDKIKSLASYEKYTRRGSIAYLNLEFAIFCYTLNTPNDDIPQKIYDKVIQISVSSALLWIVCEISKSLNNKDTVNYSIYMPNYVKRYDLFFYNRNFNSIIIYSIKKGKQIKNIIIPGMTQ